MKKEIINFKSSAKDITSLRRLTHEQLESLEISIEKGLFKNKPCQIADGETTLRTYWGDISYFDKDTYEWVKKIEKTYDIKCIQWAKDYVEYEDEPDRPGQSWVFLGYLQDVLRFLKQEKFIERVRDVKELDICIEVNFGDLTSDELSLIGELPRTPSLGDIMGLSKIEDIIDAIEKC